MSLHKQRRWCIFTSAGDKNNIRLWLEGAASRRWDLVVAYYGDENRNYLELSENCKYAFRAKGSKFQNLRKLFIEHPSFFDEYSHVWVCDDDIVMSTSQIDQAFEITERLQFWVAQPAMRAAGKNGHWINCYAGPQWDYRVVNYVEVGLPIFRRDKLIEFLAVYDGSLTGWGIEYWYANFFEADKFGRFGVLDKVQVLNPRDEDKGGNEMGRLRLSAQREADWKRVQQKFGIIEHAHKIFAYCKLAPEKELLGLFNRWLDPEDNLSTRLRITQRVPGMERLIKLGLALKALMRVARRSGWHDAIFLLKCGLSTRRQRRAVGHGFEKTDGVAMARSR